MKASCSCIIPFYNENGRIIKVLNEISQLKCFAEIICVDDGSTDGVARKINKQYPKVILLKHKKNKGKSAAIMTGLKKARASNILLIDADLHNLSNKEIEQAINIFTQQTKIDMLLLRRINSKLITKMVRTDLLHTGERILKKKDLIEVFKLKPKRFEIEVAINRYMILNKKNVMWFPISALSTLKLHKQGYIKGLLGDLKMSLGLIFYLGLNNYWKQFFYGGKIQAVRR